MNIWGFPWDWAPASRRKSADGQNVEERVGDTTVADPMDPGGISRKWALFSVTLGYMF